MTSTKVFALESKTGKKLLTADIEKNSAPFLSADVLPRLGLQHQQLYGQRGGSAASVAATNISRLTSGLTVEHTPTMPMHMALREWQPVSNDDFGTFPRKARLDKGGAFCLQDLSVCRHAVDEEGLCVPEAEIPNEGALWAAHGPLVEEVWHPGHLEEPGQLPKDEALYILWHGMD